MLGRTSWGLQPKETAVITILELLLSMDPFLGFGIHVVLETPIGLEWTVDVSGALQRWP